MKFARLLLNIFFIFMLLIVAKADCEEQNFEYVSAEKDFIDTVPQSIKYFNQAYEAYYAAKNTNVAAERGTLYATAISDIAKARIIDDSNISYVILSMQIYRGKGVLPYAKSAFLQAEKFLQNELLSNNNVRLLLDYAILCHAGDMAYRPEKEVYYQKGQLLAKEICFLLNKDEQSDNLRILAMANLVLGNEDKFLELLQKSANCIDNYGTSKFYLDLYNDTVMKKKWLWPVAEKYLQNEFLLFYLCDLSR